MGTGGEGKTMGLAPYGKKCQQVKIIKILKLSILLNGIKNSFSDFMDRMPYSDILNQISPKFRPILLKLIINLVKIKMI